MSRLTLFVIIDPTMEDQPALVRASDIANIAGGHIHAFCAVYEDDLSQYASRRDAKYKVRHRAMDKVDKLIKPLVNDRVTVDKEVIWNEHWYQSAVHACARLGADIMIKSTYTHHRSVGGLRKRSDYHLLRHNSCPVLLVKSVKPCRYQRVLAAIAIEDGDHRHDELNNLVISHARRMSRTTGGELHVVAALEGRPDLASLLNLLVDEDDEALSGEELINIRFGIEPDRIHLDYGPAKQVIVETVKKTAAQLLVIGTVARAGISGAVLGNTCEKVLDQLSIDIMTVN
jgi:universal stress protein E